jgi:phosphonate transport system permease protein
MASRRWSFFFLTRTTLTNCVRGCVGAGGLGQQMDTSKKMFNGSEVATMLLVFIALVALTDYASAWLRKSLA